MLKEYFDKTGFVITHGILLFLYIIISSYSGWRLIREYIILRNLKKGASSENNKSILINATPNKMLSEKLIGKSSLLNIFKETRQNQVGGKNKPYQSPIELFTQAIASTDDLIRFCINGFVVVGLMGTLHAFYIMWRNYSSSGSSGSSNANTNTPYLEGMATALVVSFFGLVLALTTNFLFSILKTVRQKLIISSARFFSQFNQPSTQDSKDIILIEAINSLKISIHQLGSQNDSITQGIATILDARTENLHEIYLQSTTGLRALLDELSKNLMQVLANLHTSSNNLSNSSQDIAKTLSEVSKGLESTKDIGKIIIGLETISEDIIVKISKKLEEATNKWAKKISTSVQDHIKASELQTKLIENLVKGLTVKTITDFKSVSNEIKESLISLNSEFSDKTDSIAAYWMTKMSSGLDDMTQITEGIVKGWQEVVTNTSLSISTTLFNSSEQMHEITEKIKALNNEVETLHLLLMELDERAGAPLYLSKATDELSLTRQSLEGLITHITRNQNSSDLKTMIETTSAALHNIEQSTEAMSSTRTDEVINTIGELQKTLISSIQSLESKFPSPKLEGAGTGTIAAINNLKAQVSSIQNDLISGNVTVKVHSSPHSSPDEKDKKSWVTTITDRISWKKSKNRKNNN